MAKDYQLFLTAGDYLQFTTNFFDIINVSATHIYHSALELSPSSSIVRKLYFHQQSNLSPRIVIGAADSWELTRAIPTKDSWYLSCVWSPCSQFIAVMAENAVEIRDALTLKPLSTLQSTGSITRFRGKLAYSPDGYSLAGCSNSAVIIWDTQTGGEVAKIVCTVTRDGLDLIWSTDGKTIATVSPWESTITVHTYSIASGKLLFMATLRSTEKPHIWAHEKSFQIMTTSQEKKGRAYNIFEVGSTLTRVESFPSNSDLSPYAFSPVTYQVALSNSSRDNGELFVVNIKTSEISLHEKGAYLSVAFSPDAFILAAVIGHFLSIWKYSSGHYVLWKKFQQGWPELQFSPNSSSILCYGTSFLNILHLEYSTPALATESTHTIHGQSMDAFSPAGLFIATAYQGESTIRIINLQSQSPFPSQFIDTELEISEMVLTGNVLLVKSSDKFVAWLLTEDGMVDGIIGNSRADCNDSIWEISIPSLLARLAKLPGKHSFSDGGLGFFIAGEIAVIRSSYVNLYSYHTRTGEVIRLEKPSLGNNILYRFDKRGHDECNLYHNSLCAQQGPLEYGWSISQEGWVRDPEGKHRLWLPPSWRLIKDNVNWLHNTRILRLRSFHELIIIKF